MTRPTEASVRFGRFALDGPLRELREGSALVPLSRKPMELLWYLIRNRHRVVPGSELLENVWPDAYVSEQTLASTLRDLRRALGDADHTLIQTLRGQGYRFTARIDVASEDDALADREAHLPSPPRSASSPPSTEIVGREEELAHLQSALESAARGDGGVRLLTGPAGIGKTRLADEVVTRAGAAGFRVHTGWCHSTPGFPPLWDWAEIAASCLESASEPALREEWLEASGPWLRSLVTASEHPGETSPSADSNRAHFGIAHGLVRLLGRAAQEGPRLLVLEDLHFADADSLLVLEMVTKLLPDLPVLLVATMRTDEGDLDAAMRRALATIGRSRGCARVELCGLDLAGVRKLMAGNGSPPPENVLSRAWEVAGGNPLFVTEMARLHGEGRLDRQPGSAGALPVPLAVREVLELALARRSPSCQRALRLAAVIGEEFTIELLHGALGGSREAVLDALSEAESGGVIRESDTRGGSYRFHHALWREFLYDSFTSVDARRAHLRVAEAIETLPGRDIGPHLATLAYHFAEAAPVGGAHKAVRYARAAAARADRLWLAMGTADLYRLALDALDAIDDADARMRSELHIARGMHLRLSARRSEHMAEARSELDAGARLARDAQAFDLLACAVVGRVQLELEPYLALGATPLVERSLIEALEAELSAVRQQLGSAHPEARARLLLWTGYTRLCAGDRDGAERLVGQSEAISRTLEDRELARETLFLQWTLAQAPSRLAERQAIADRVRQLGGDADAPPSMLRDRWLVFVEAERGHIAAAEALIASDRPFDPRRPWEDPDVWIWRAMRALMSGAFGEAEHLLGAMGRMNNLWIGMARQAQLDWLRLAQGRAAEIVDGAEIAARALGHLSATHLWLSRCHVALGNSQRARDALDRALRSKLVDLPTDQGWIFAHALAAECVYAVRAPEHAAWIYERLAPFANRLVMQAWFVICRGFVDRPLGLLAAVRGSFDAAVTHLESALRRHEALEAAPLVVETQVDLACVLSQRASPRDAARARDLLERARAATSALGMAGLGERARLELERM